MNVFIDNLEIDPGIIGPPAMNYGQPWRWHGFPRRHYEYAMSHDEFGRIAAVWWDKLSSELKSDMEFTAKGENPELDRLDWLGYPSLGVMMRDFRNDLAAVLLWTDLELLNQVGGHMAHMTPLLYVANSLEAVSVSADAIRFSGMAFEMKLT